MANDFIHALNKLVNQDGYSRTYLPEVSLFRAANKVPDLPIVYEKCLCFAIQGSKTAVLSDRKLTYDRSHFLVVPAIIPFQCVTELAGTEPFLGVVVGIDTALVRSIVESLGEDFGNAIDELSPCPGIYMEHMTSPVEDALLRLLQSLRTKSDAAVLGRAMVRELMYRTLMSDNGEILAATTRDERAIARITKAMGIVHTEYGSDLDVDQLAARVGMSARSFHEHFKGATSCTPYQYLKKIRLDKARYILVSEGIQTKVAAQMVGYGSAAQFSRAFKDHFGYSPSEASENFSPRLVREVRPTA